MFGAVIRTKWFVTQDLNGITYYLESSNNGITRLVWTQQVAKALKFDASVDAEKVMEAIKLHHKNNKTLYKVK